MEKEMLDRINDAMNTTGMLGETFEGVQADTVEGKLTNCFFIGLSIIFNEVSELLACIHLDITDEMREHTSERERLQES